ncbi:MAG: 3-dehydroquinate synthase [Rikenellaceae bacterium]
MDNNYTLNIKDQSKVCIGSAGELLKQLLPQGRVIVISDINIDRLYHPLISRFESILIGTGETIKTLTTMEKIYSQLVEMGADRKTFILGIGGGIVTDIAGFVASTYMRGVKFGFISTTLLSQVDAGVGGKNGVNLGGYKNMIGTFNQPEFVICDVDMLKTLSDREFRTGLAEVIKSAIIADPALFDMLEQTSLEELRENRELLSRAIMASVTVKAKIVEMDEREAGERRKLNLGHTFAHAIEKSSNLMNHGEAVAVGTNIVTDISIKLGIIDTTTAERINALHIKMGFDLTSPVEPRKLLKAISHDKKAEEGVIYMVLPRAIGDCEVRKMTFSEVEKLVG